MAEKVQKKEIFQEVINAIWFTEEQAELLVQSLDEFVEEERPDRRSERIFV